MMTANQIKALENQERVRHNLADEGLKARELTEQETMNAHERKLGIAKAVISGVSGLVGGSGTLMRGIGSLRNSGSRKGGH